MILRITARLSLTAVTASRRCTGRVQKALEALDGVKSVVMSLEEGTATVELEEGAGGAALKAAVNWRRTPETAPQ